MRRISIIAAALVLLGLGVWTFWDPELPTPIVGAAHRLAASAPEPILASPPEAHELSLLVGSYWSSVKLPPAPSKQFWGAPNLGMYVAARSGGERLEHIWDVGPGSVAEAFGRAIGALRGSAPESDTLEVFIVTDRSYQDPGRVGDRAAVMGASHRGVRGFEVQWGDDLRLYAPTLLLASNRRPQRQLQLSLGELGVSIDDFETGGELYALDGPQYLVRLDPDGETSATQMVRGNELVPLGSVSAESTRQLTGRAADWMLRALHDDGRFTYKYWPSRGEESDSNNMIRQWMASHALVKIAERRNDPALWDRIDRNIDYNLDHFYREETRDGETLGLIEFRNKVKLGAVGLAALVLAEHPERERWREQYLALNRTVESLWNEDGRFDTFYQKPPTTRDQPNFYPGEALLMWVDRYAREPDPELLARIMASFRYYRDWHLDPANRNPAFVPWHVRAYTKLWRKTRDPELAALVFEMSDWLLTMQEWTPAYPDFLGRFHDPARPNYGPPHASSTGVYLEGYIEALQLARALGEYRRAENYRRAILGGLRSLMQLQFVDGVDMYYVTDRRLVEGGIRTTVYDNEIRCDNVQHGLMAMLDIVDTFGDSDYVVR